MKRLVPVLAGLCVTAMLASGCRAQTRTEASPLVLERRIPLANVAGRIDHLALDPARRRLFVAELGNGSVEAVDLASGRSLGRIGGLREPQGVGFLPARDELAVATGGDGRLSFYRADGLDLLGSLKLGADADNVRVEGRTGMVAVGYGAGALAIVDPATRKVVRIQALPAHPEAFQFTDGRIVVNVPDAGGVVVLDARAGRPLSTWPNRLPGFNFPMAFDPSADMVAVVYRLPARLVLFAAGSGDRRQVIPTCGDADDVWFDGRRKRIYVICGEGAVDVFALHGGGYVHAGRIATRPGARTGFFSPELDRLYVALRANGGQPAEIWTLRPQ